MCRLQVMCTSLGKFCPCIPLHGRWLGSHPCCSALLVTLEWAPWWHPHQQRLQLSQKFQATAPSRLQVASDSDAGKCGLSLALQFPKTASVNCSLTVTGNVDVRSTTYLQISTCERILPTPRPSRISMVMDRETTSREARSLAVGAYLSINLSPSLLRNMPPSPLDPKDRAFS